jgi:hypothetical protein
MPDIRSFDLVTAVIIEPDSAEATRVLLAEGTNYGWELPGAKVPEGTDSLDVLSDAMSRKLGIWIAPDENTMPLIEAVDVSMAGIAIHAEIRRIRSYSGVLMETEESGYRQTLWANPLKHQLGRIGLSPVAEKFRYIVSNSPRLLLQ